jgi:hypothetical protein
MTIKVTGPAVGVAVGVAGAAQALKTMTPIIIMLNSLIFFIPTSLLCKCPISS